MKLALKCLVWVFVIIYQAALALPPVDLGIQNLTQETPVWCWVAVSQQLVLKSKGPAFTPPQCAMAGIATNVGPQACCAGHPACIQTGSLTQIQQLIAYFGGSYSTLAPPADPYTLYNTLSNGYAVILQLKTTPPGYPSGMSHVVILRGMMWNPTPYGEEPVLLINDPMSYFTQPVPFAAIAQQWQAAIVVKVY